MEEDEETDEVEVLEECPNKPTASEVRSEIDVLTSSSLFVNEGLEEITAEAMYRKLRHWQNENSRAPNDSKGCFLFLVLKCNHH